MKPAILISIRIFFIIITLFYTDHEVFSQNNLPEKWKHPGFFIGAGAGLANTQIVNKGTLSVSDKLQKRKSSVIGLAEAGYFISKSLGLITGVNYYSSISSYCSLENYQNHYYTFDVENDPFEMIVEGSDFIETQKIELLSIPFCISFRKPLSKKFGISFQSGINFLFPLKNSFQSNGTFTYKGYFPSYNVLLEDLPEYGFATNLNIVSNGKAELKPLSFGPFVSAGFDCLVKERVQLVISGYFDRSLTSISNYSSPDELLFSETAQLNNTLRGSNETKLQSVGIRFSIRYFLTDYIKFKYYFHPTPKENLREYERQRNNLSF